MSNNRELKKGYPRAMVELSMFCGYTHTYWHCGLPCLNSLCCLEMDGTEGRCLHWCRNCSEAPNCCAPLTLLSSLHHRTRGLLVSTKGLQKGLQSRAQNKRFACVNVGFTKGVTKQNTNKKSACVNNITDVAAKEILYKLRSRTPYLCLPLPSSYPPWGVAFIACIAFLALSLLPDCARFLPQLDTRLSLTSCFQARYYPTRTPKQ